MSISDTVKELSKVTKIAFDNYIKFKDAEVRKYQNQEHVMTGISEVIVPSKQELYVFEKEFWNLNIEDNYIVLTKKETKRRIDKSEML